MTQLQCHKGSNVSFLSVNAHLHHFLSHPPHLITLQTHPTSRKTVQIRSRLKALFFCFKTLQRTCGIAQSLNRTRLKLKHHYGSLQLICHPKRNFQLSARTFKYLQTPPWCMVGSWCKSLAINQNMMWPIQLLYATFFAHHSSQIAPKQQNSLDLLQGSIESMHLDLWQATSHIFNSRGVNIFTHE